MKKGWRGGRSFSSLCAIFKNVSDNAASTMHSAADASAASLSRDETQREKVQWAGFDLLVLGPTNAHHVLLLTYSNGFQVWDVQEADNVQELVSKRDGPVAFLRVLPRPHAAEPSEGLLQASQPLLLVVTSDITNSGPVGNAGHIGGLPTPGGFVPSLIRFYSMQSHAYVRDLKFHTAIYAVRCSCRIIAVSLLSQICCFDAGTLESTFSVLTYASPQAGLGGSTAGYGAMALGPRWLAYAANQPLVTNTGRVSPQHFSPSPGGSPSTSPASASLVPQFAKESSKQVAVGIVNLADMGMKTLSTYCSKLLPDAGTSPGSLSANGSSPRNTEPDYAGIVIVRDFVNKSVIAQFRAHTSPISALCFDPSGTLLVTASVNGQNLNVFRIMPSCNSSAPHIHLYKLYRGLTNAVIQDVSFSYDSHWIAVSSSRGTSHLFAISPYGGVVSPQTHGAVPVDLPWWASNRMVRFSQQAGVLPPSTIMLSVVNRIKNGSGSWRETVSGAAAVATGRTMFSNGAVSVMFHDGGGKSIGSEGEKSTFRDQLWVFFPSGHLIRYGLRPSAVLDGSYERDAASSTEIFGVQDLHVAVEPLQRWDVCRRPNWLEREENIGTINSSYESLNETGARSFIGERNVAAPSRSIQRSGRDETSEEMHQWFLSNAELQMHEPKPPIWGKSEISFYVYDKSVKDSVGGEIEIEKTGTTMVEVRRKDLVPVFKRFQKLSDLTIKSTPNTIDSTRKLMNNGKLQDSFIHTNGRSMQIQGVNNVIGFVPMETSVARGNKASNGFNEYQGIQYALETPTISFYQKHTSPPISEKLFLQSGRISDSECSTPTAPNSSVDLIGSPPMNIPPNIATVSYHSPSTFNGFVDRAQGDSPACLVGASLPTPSLPIVPNGRQKFKVESVRSLNPHVSRLESDVVGEDESSTDANSKSEDYDGGERVEDAWDGAMFPFPEEN